MLINCLCKVQLSITKTKSVHSFSYSSHKVEPLCTHVKNGLIDIYVTDSSQEQHVRSFNKGIINTISQ